MVQLPTFRDLGPLPSAQTGRAIASYDTSAAAGGLGDAGAAISSAATAIGKMAGSSGRRGGASQAEQFETNRQFLEFVSGQQQAYEESKQSIEPGAFGFREQAQQNYLNAAKEFFSAVPDSLKPEYDYKLFSVEDDFLNNSRTFETTERTRYYGEEVNKGLNTIENDLFANPGNFDKNYVQGLDYINSIPDEHVSRIEKAELASQWRTKAQLASLNGVSPQERIRLLGGAPNEVEAKPSVSRNQEITRGISGDVRKTISDVAVSYGVDPNSMLTIAWLESRGNPNAKNPNSSAGGLFQFIDSTASAYGLADKFNPAAAADAAARLARDNSAALERVLGRKPTTGELYLAHQQGAGGAIKLLSNPNVRAADLVGAEAVRLNGGKTDMTAGEFAMLWTKKAGDTNVPDGGLFNAQFDAASADPRFADMNYIDAQKAIQGAQAEIDASINEAEKALSDQVAAGRVQYDQHKGSLELAIETGELNSELSILNDDILTDAHKADLIASYKAKNKERMQTADALAAFEVGELAVDPYASDGRKVVDNMFKEVAKTAEPEEIQATTEEIVRQTGIVPQSALNVIRRGLTSQEPADVMAAAQSAQRLSTVDRAALGRRDGGKEVQDAADDFSYYVDRLNLSPEEAAQKLMEARDPQMQRDRKALEPLAKEFVKERQDEDVAALFNDSFFSSDPALGFTPMQEAGIKSEYISIAEEEFYRANGDADIAKNRAVERMKELYGVTGLTGRRVVMRHPPERHWPALRFGTSGKTLDYATNQLLGELQQFDPGVSLDRVQIVSTLGTDRMVKRGELPGYAITWKDENGVDQALPGQLWLPDMEAMKPLMEFERRTEERAEEARIGKARRRQESERKLRDLQELRRRESERLGGSRPRTQDTTGPQLPTDGEEPQGDFDRQSLIDEGRLIDQSGIVEDFEAIGAMTLGTP